MKKTLMATLALVMAVSCLTGCIRATGQSIPEETNRREETKAYPIDPMDTAAPLELGQQEYTNVPGAPTQNAVSDYTLSYFPDTQEEITHTMTVLEPDTLIVTALKDIYDFARETDKMPVRYFPEDVQQAVEKILGGASADILHMSEFFGIQPEFALEDGETALGQLELEEEYTPGQLVVVMFGDTTGVDTENLTREALEAIQWTPLKAQVKEVGQITFDIPPQLLEEIHQEESLFLVLTIRKGTPGEEDQQITDEPASAFIPSKDAGDLTQEQEEITSADGSVLPDSFRIFVREHTDTTRQELNRLQTQMTQENKPIAACFDEALQNQMSLLLETDDTDSLICYNANFLGAENYEDTYGDVIAGFRFATVYPDGTRLVCLLGTLKEEETGESPFDWAALRGEVKDGYVYITFPQQLIPVMEEKGALALILSEPITGEEN